MANISVPDEERSFSKDRELASEDGKKGEQARGGSTPPDSASGSEEADDDTSGSGGGNLAGPRAGF